MTADFGCLGLDQRLLRAVDHLGWTSPTPVQEKTIELALQGRDILARARTGSGKTGAYILSLLQCLLDEKSTVANNGGENRHTQGLILVPTKELCEQARRNLSELTTFCGRDVSVLQLPGDVAISAQIPSLRTVPDILISTPARIAAHVAEGSVSLVQLRMLVIDEADLMFSFGYEDDVRMLLPHLPAVSQTMLLSATLTPDVESLRRLVLHNPAIVNLNESQLPDADRLTQYSIECRNSEKFLLTIALLQLKLLPGKTLFFVNSIDRCYELKLFLEQFSIQACVLNSELPQNSRCHVVDEFNKGIYSYIIATDEIDPTLAGEDDDDVEEDEGISENEQISSGVNVIEEVDDGDDVSIATSKATMKTPSTEEVAKTRRRRDYGVARGVDFRDVQNVVNFDFPVLAKAYVHRVGRTARGASAEGTALSFICDDNDRAIMRRVERRLRSSQERLDPTVAVTGIADDESSLLSVRPFAFKADQVDGFRYRVDDALKLVTKQAVKAARLKEIKIEILNSKKLQSHFVDNPKDLSVLRHGKRFTHQSKILPTLKHVPDYLVPDSLKPTFRNDSNVGSTKVKGSKRNSKRGGRKNDPLRSFSFERYNTESGGSGKNRSKNHRGRGRGGGSRR